MIQNWPGRQSKVIYAIDEKNVSHHDYHNRRQQRRHSLAALEQSRVYTTSSRLSRLENDLANGSTRSRIFHSSMTTEILTELDQLLALNQSNKPSSLHVSPKNKNVTTDTEILDKLTQQIEHLKRSYPIHSTTLQQRRQTQMKKKKRLNCFFYNKNN